MQFFRFGMMLFMCVCLAGATRADGDEAMDDEKSEHDTAKAVLAVAKIDLTKAIAIAQAKIPTGKPLYAIAAEGSKSVRFDVFLLVGDSVTEVKVDAVSGKIDEVEENENDEIENLDDAKKVLAASKITFAQAIATAKTKVEGGKPFAIETELEQDKFIIAVMLLAGDRVMLVGIDAVSGEVVEVEEEGATFSKTEAVF